MTSAADPAHTAASDAEGDLRLPPSAAPPCAKWSDGELMAAVSRRDEVAYSELYRRHVVSVAATTRMVLGQGPQGDDVVAGVFLGLWVAPDRFDASRGTLLGYLRMAARGRSIDLLRSEMSRKRREQHERDPGEGATPDFDAALLALETSEELHRAVAQLPPAEREAVRLAYFSGMSYRAVARHLGEPEGTVKSRIRSGLQHLRDGGIPR